MSSPISTESSASPTPDTEQLICHAATFTSRVISPDIEVVSARGELDAANSQQFVTFALRNATTTKKVILDLTDVVFFGTAGFSALHTFNVQCAGEQVDWALVPGTAVTRVLRICDPDSVLPTGDSIETASTALKTEPGPLLQLVAEPS
jgi:anti-anti-sigma factor